MPHYNIWIMKSLNELKNQLYSSDWNISLNSAERLAKLNSNKSVSILIEGLNSNNNFTRNACALGIRGMKNEYAFKELWNCIMKLGPYEEIGTLVYALEMSDCSCHLLELLSLYIDGNFEVENSIETIISEQIFKIKDVEESKLKKLILSNKLKLSHLKIITKKINEA